MKKIQSLLGSLILALCLVQVTSAQVMPLPPSDPLELLQRVLESAGNDRISVSFWCFPEDQTYEGMGEVFNVILRVPNTQLADRILNQVPGFTFRTGAGGDREYWNTITGDPGDNLCPPMDQITNLLASYGYVQMEKGFWQNPNSTPPPGVVPSFQFNTLNMVSYLPYILVGFLSILAVTITLRQRFS